MNSNCVYSYSYNSKRVDIFMRERSYDIHKKKLHQIKTKKQQQSETFNKSTHKSNSLRQKHKQFYNKESLFEINRVNEQIYNKIQEIAKRTPNQSNKDDDNNDSQMKHKRLKEQQIQYENEKIAARIINQTACIKFSLLEDQFENHLNIRDRLQRFGKQQDYVKKLRSQDFSLLNTSKHSQEGSGSNTIRRNNHKLQPLSNKQFGGQVMEVSNNSFENENQKSAGAKKKHVKNLDYEYLEQGDQNSKVYKFQQTTLPYIDQKPTYDQTQQEPTQITSSFEKTEQKSLNHQEIPIQLDQKHRNYGQSLETDNIEIIEEIDLNQNSQQIKVEQYQDKQQQESQIKQ